MSVCLRLLQYPATPDTASVSSEKKNTITSAPDISLLEPKAAAHAVRRANPQVVFAPAVTPAAWTGMVLHNMSYPREKAVARHPTKTAKPKGKPAVEQPFDPDELTRRLYTVLAEQNIQAERRRRAKVEALDRKAREAKEAKSAAAKKAAGEKSFSRAPPDGPTAAYKKTDGEKSSVRAPPDGPSTAKLPWSKSSPPRAPPKESTPRTSSSGAAEHPGAYRHVPQEAAKQFTRTTTAGSMRDVGLNLGRKPSKRSVKHQPEGFSDRPAAVGSEPTGAPHDQTRILRHAHSQRERLREGNKLQSSRIEEEVPEGSELRDGILELPTLGADFGHRTLDKQQQKAARRNSTGNLLLATPPEEANHRHSLIALEPPAEDGEDAAPSEPDPSMAQEHHRVDWTQSDEATNRSRLLLSPLLRRADSIWALKGRLGNTNKHNRDDKAPTLLTKPEPSQSSDGLKSPKANFFSRFKR